MITSESSSRTSVRRRPRRLARAAAVSTGLALVALAAPASADVPEGWSNPEDVDTLHALLLLAGVPLLLFVVIAVLTYLPAIVRGEKLTPGAAEDQWFGGPRQGAKELEPGTSSDETGGARGRW
ncbi:hypothetical protein [Nocardioides sp. Soil805]|uniref:hypothetical protein n=1 Tax=Nocardioides sp. Soil805 TaxID=1736416 RepID=UPI000702F8D1|nr:hypothetical protein [Nocardioides sp. Soil805]KRF36564.1 hypothetical protein ASG94_03740 [Nocardioides sp. Soil805]